MHENIASSLTWLSAAGAGLVTGSLFAFSTFVMPALDRIAPAPATTAMQSINRLAPNSLFGAALAGTAVAAGTLAGLTAFRWEQPGNAAMITGGALYIIGVCGITAAINQPMNIALAQLAPDAPDSGTAWRTYAAAWNRWNHLRTASGLAATVAYIVALRQIAAG